MAQPKYFAITRLDDDFNLEIIDGYDDEEMTEEMVERYSERFPHAVIDYHPVF